MAWLLNRQKRGPSRIFHYSSVDHVLSILESATLWASDALSLNDASELAYGCGVVTEALQSTVAIPDLVKRLVTDDDNGRPKENFLLGMSKTRRSYVSCFCQKGDLLSQWRAYGKGGGIAVGFDRIALSTKHEPSYMVRVAYQRGKQLDAVRSSIRCLAEIATRFPGETAALLYWLRALSEAMLPLIVCCKDAVFSEEAEWRLVRQGYRTPKFRATSRMIIPYFEMPFSKDTVKELVLGPTLAPAVVEHSLKAFLENTGYGHVAVRRSKIPLRSL
jgi:hypothetical protein